MDPTFAEYLRGYLTALAFDHRRVDGPVCPCGLAMPDGRDTHLLDVIARDCAASVLAPHVVHVDGAFEDLPTEIRLHPDDPEGLTPELDADDEPIYTTGRRYLGPADCPDCGRGLSSRSDDMICLRLSRDVALRGCHPGCIVACGGTP